MSQSSLFDGVGVVWRSCSIAEANQELVRWGHKMCPMNRPDYGDVTAQGLYHDGRIVALTCTAGLVRETVAGVHFLHRSCAIELARLCAERPGLCRVALRLWREFTFPSTGKEYAVSYQDADLHNGNIYRFDGWVRFGFVPSHGVDQRTGRRGRNKYVWIWKPGIVAPPKAALEKASA